MYTTNDVFYTGNAAGNLTSTAFWLDQVFIIAIQALFTGTAAGTVKLQGSCDRGSVSPLNPAGGLGITTWTDIANSSTAVTGAGSVTWNFTGVGYEWIRVVYTSSSGTGTMTCTANAKG